MPFNHKRVQNKINHIIKTNSRSLIHMYYSNDEIFQIPPHRLSHHSLNSFIGWTITIRSASLESFVITADVYQ